MILNLVSKVHTRNPQPLGDLSLNIAGVTPQQVSQIRALLSNILALQLDLKITTQSLTEMRF